MKTLAQVCCGIAAGIALGTAFDLKHVMESAFSVAGLALFGMSFYVGSKR